ncbi:MAG: transglycosylase SLT domain-containing protein [Gammaproteobacteria bacterium]
MMLSAGIIFILGLAMNASSILGVQENFLELARASAEIRALAAHSSELAGYMQYHPRGEALPLSETPASPDRHTASVKKRPGKTSLRRPVQTGKADPDPGVMEQSPSAAAARSTSPERGAGELRDYGKWGPPLLLNVATAADSAGQHGLNPYGEEIQDNLRALGFDVPEDHANGRTGARTLQALNEFRLLYLPSPDRKKSLDSEQLTASIRKYAVQARKDKRKFSIDSGILAAIRLGSMRTGVEFSFLMELAATESSFDPTSVAPKTAAAGLYQFKGDTWLETVRNYGKKYGMGVYAAQIEDYTDDAGKKRLRIHDPVIHEYVLTLRHNPRISALLAAEYVKYNRRRLTNTLDREPGHTELYLTHFFGTTGAISFLKALYENPDRIADEVFPKAAITNQAIFRPKSRKPRTVAEIYKMFQQKFSTTLYMDANPS